MKAMYEVVGRLIRKCIRSFDDGYRSDTNEFVMCLKHSVASGGTAAVNRLSSYLEEESFLFELDVDGEKKRYTLTMSYCVAEPVPICAVICSVGKKKRAVLLLNMLR